MEIVNECQREIDKISSVYNTDKIFQDLQFLSIYYIKHAKWPGRDRNISSVLQECIVDTHLTSDVSGNESLHDASSRLRQVFFSIWIFFLRYKYMAVAWLRNLATTTSKLEIYNNNSNKKKKLYNTEHTYI